MCRNVPEAARRRIPDDEQVSSNNDEDLEEEEEEEEDGDGDGCLEGMDELEDDAYLDEDVATKADDFLAFEGRNSFAFQI